MQGRKDMGFDEMTGERELYSLTDFFKALGDPTRVKILLQLFDSEVCVGDLAGRLNITDSAVSHQLHVLKSNRLVRETQGRKNDGICPCG